MPTRKYMTWVHWWKHCLSALPIPDCPWPSRSHRTWWYSASFNFLVTLLNCNSYPNSNTTIHPNIKHRILALNTVLNTAQGQWELGLRIQCPPETHQPSTLSPTPFQSVKSLTQGFTQKHASSAFQVQPSLQLCPPWSLHSWEELSHPSIISPLPNGKLLCSWLKNDFPKE